MFKKSVPTFPDSLWNWVSDIRGLEVAKVYPDSGESIPSKDKIFVFIIGSQIISFSDQSDWSKIQEELAEPVPRPTSLLGHFDSFKL